MMMMMMGREKRRRKSLIIFPSHRAFHSEEEFFCRVE